MNYGIERDVTSGVPLAAQRTALMYGVQWATQSFLKFARAYTMPFIPILRMQ